MASVLLVNLNRIAVPPVAPYAIDILGSSLADAGHDVGVLDLHGVHDTARSIETYFRSNAPDLIGVSVRNTGDLYFPSFLDLTERGSYLPDHAGLIAQLKRFVPEERIVVGGVGLSSNAIRLTERLGVRYGVVGPGEAVFTELAAAMDAQKSLSGALAHKRIPSPHAVTLFDGRKDRLAARVSRRFVDNARYYRISGLAGVRTSNGCGMSCSYCVEPVAKGSSYRRRSVADVIAEIDQLVDLGIFDIHTCDSEFNMPFEHAKSVLRAVAARNYPKRLRLWAYCQASPFDDEFGRLLAAANVAGVNFGVDHTDPEILRRLGKTWYTAADIRRSTIICRGHGIAVNHELIFGYPGDTPDRMLEAVDYVMALNGRAVGVVIGVAVLPGTKLGQMLQERLMSGASLKGFYMAGEPLTDPTYFVDPSFDIPEVFARLERHVGSECRRVMVPQVNSTAPGCNQLVGSERVRRDLERGRTGAYWYHYPSRFEDRIGDPIEFQPTAIHERGA